MSVLGSLEGSLGVSRTLEGSRGLWGWGLAAGYSSSPHPQFRILWFHVRENSIFECARESEGVSRAVGLGAGSGVLELPTPLNPEIKSRILFRIQKFRDHHVAPTQPTRWVGEFLDSSFASYDFVYARITFLNLLGCLRDSRELSKTVGLGAASEYSSSGSGVLELHISLNRIL